MADAPIKSLRKAVNDGTYTRYHLSETECAATRGYSRQRLYTAFRRQGHEVTIDHANEWIVSTAEAAVIIDILSSLQPRRTVSTLRQHVPAVIAALAAAQDNDQREELRRALAVRYHTTESAVCTLEREIRRGATARERRRLRALAGAHRR